MGLSGYMDCGNLNFYRDNYDAVSYWIGAAVVGGLVPVIAFIITPGGCAVPICGRLIRKPFRLGHLVHLTGVPGLRRTRDGCSSRGVRATCYA